MSEITPALTAEIDGARLDVDFIRFGNALVISTEVWSGLFKGVDLLHFVALANAALPDDDPRKITRADVKLLRAYVDWMRREIPHPRLPELEAIASKLAAILPPASESDRVRDELPPLA